MSEPFHFADLDAVAAHLRERIDYERPDRKKYVLLFGYNGTGKTRLSMAFKEHGKQDETADTLYFNAFTEDLFYWDNDLADDAERVLCMNTASRFFDGLQELAMEDRIREHLTRYVDFDFRIDYEQGNINFIRQVADGESTKPAGGIKVSRGEENLFVWCFFLAVAELAIDEQEAYSWVKYLYIDDPISSLDDNHAIAVANHLAQLLKRSDNGLRTVISSHHHLFFNVMCNELGKAEKNFLSKTDGGYWLKNTGDTPRYHHVALLKELCEVAESGNIYTYHFNILRNILEKTATFHGFDGFAACIRQGNDDPDGVLHARLINVLSHGKYSLYEPLEMLPENKAHFRRILTDFMSRYRFNPDLFPKAEQEGTGS